MLVNGLLALALLKSYLVGGVRQKDLDGYLYIYTINSFGLTV